MSAPYDRTPAQVEALERATGLQLYGWLSAPPVLLPILGRPGLDAAHRRALVLRLNRAGLAAELPRSSDRTALAGA
ncbi:MAG: hypothetical protein WCI67_24240 [Chloroflexales bacterium]